MDGLERAARSLGFTVVNERDHVHVQAFRSDQIPAWIYDQVST
jgi:hypothetical protein